MKIIKQHIIRRIITLGLPTLFGMLIPFSAEALEKNLINNSNFIFGMKCWRYTGSGKVELLPKGISINGGRLSHYIDLGNLEHTQPMCGAPYGQKFRFRVSLRGKGTVRLGIRARIMTAGNALEFSELWSGKLTLPEKFANLDFEAAETNRDAVFHDKLMLEFIGDGNAEIRSTTFFYLDRKGPEISFEPAAAAVRPGDTVKVAIRTSEPERKLECSLFPGQFQIGGYFPAKHWTITTGKDGKVELSFQVPFESPDGVRLSVLDTANGVKENFFASILPEKQLNEYRKISKNISGTQHLLFLGDSLSDYDRGRNYISLAHSFLPKTYSIRNAGVGGDTLGRIWLRLQGKPTIRNNMYDNLFVPKPDTIFIFCGANDSKATYKSGYEETYTPESEQEKLWEQIIVYLKKQTGAKIVLITSVDSYQPYQEALAAPMRKAGISHSIFGIPEVLDRFNARVRAMAEKHGLDVIDFASAVRAFNDPQLLYVPDDGVHLSVKGHQLLAGQLLKYLAEGEKLIRNADGTAQISKKLSFNGKTRVRLQNSSDVNITDAGLTICVTLNPKHGSNESTGKGIGKTPESLDMYVFKDNAFFFGRYGDRIYANFHDGTRYCAHTMSRSGIFPAPGKRSQVVAVFEPLPSDKGGYSIALYQEGHFSARKKFPGKKVNRNNTFIELGYGWGGGWAYHGELHDVKILPYALSAKQIAELFAKTNQGEAGEK